MSETLNSAMELLRAKLDGQSIDGSVKFEIEDVGTIRIEGSEVSLDDGEADCAIVADEETFRGIVDGDTSPTAAFMSGKLRVEGDMSKAMVLSSLLS